MEWQTIATVAAATMVGFVVRQYMSLPDKMRDEDKLITGRLAVLEKEVAVIKETKLSEQQVRQVMHEQLKPLQADLKSLKDQHENMSGTINDMRLMLVRIEGKLSNDEVQAKQS